MDDSSFEIDAPTVSLPLSPVGLGHQPDRKPQISIVAPTYNERQNVRPLVQAIGVALGSIRWEMIFVDDDSPDGTYLEIAALVHEGAPIRCIRRIGRRGLASAVVEGAMAANADIVAVIDADMQHDETLLPRMYETLKTSEADIVIASRHVEGGGLGDWDKGRQRMSAIATLCSKLLLGQGVSDPMSGFFATRRAVFDAAIYDLSQQGYKILLDILTSSPRSLKVVELPYVFRDRLHGASKVDVMVIAEYAFLLIEKLTRGMIPPRFVLFASIGVLGLAAHLTVLVQLKGLGASFLAAQAGATLCAMSFNYVLNNAITYRSQRLKGLRFVLGYLIFCAVCSFGAIANIGVANLMIHQIPSWSIAGALGAMMSSVFNFGVATRFVWGQRRRPARAVASTSASLIVSA